MRTRILELGLLLLAACGTSPRVTFHDLSMATGPHQPLPPSVRSVQVAAVHVPPSLDRREMVTQAGAYGVDISDRDRWSAPLAEMTRRVLSQDLQARLPDGVVVMPNMPTGPDTALIVVSLVQFGADASGRAQLVGSWSLSRARRGEVLLRRDVSLSTSLSGTGADATAAAMSDLLGQLATNIASTLAGS